jgi:hypothetical protein
VNAEEMLEQLSASDDLVSSLDVGMAENAMSADEADILRELEGDKEKAPTRGEKGTGAPESTPRESAPPQREGPQAE